MFNLFDHDCDNMITKFVLKIGICQLDCKNPLTVEINRDGNRCIRMAKLGSFEMGGDGSVEEMRDAF